MKIKSLEAIHPLRYHLRPSELEAAAATFRKYYRYNKRRGYWEQELAGSRRKLTLTREKNSGKKCLPTEEVLHWTYRALLEYTPATPLDYHTLSWDMAWLQELTDIPFETSLSRTRILPSGLLHFCKPWDYSTTTEQLKSRENPTAHHEAQLRFYGKVTEKSQVKELQSLAERVFLPVRKREDYWETRTDDGGGGGNIPQIVLKQHFPGEMTRQAERDMNAFYNAILDFVLKYEITEGFKVGDEQKPFAHLIESLNPGSNMHDSIRVSHAAYNTEYAPRLSIGLFIPAGRVETELSQQRKRIIKERTAKFMHLIYL